MSLVGNVETVPLTDVLQLLESSRRSGRLQVVQNHRATTVYVHDGRVVACSASDPPKLLGQFLLYSGSITEEVLRDAMAEQAASSASLPAILVAMGAVGAPELEQAVVAKSHEALLGLFDLKEATFRFDDHGRPGPNDVKVDWTISDLVLRGAKREDDRKRVQALFPSSAVPRATGKRPPDGGWQDRPTGRVFAAVDGERTVEAIAIQVHGSEHLVGETLLHLLDGGFVEVKAAATPAARPAPAPAADPEPHAARSPQSEDHRALSALERARGCLDAGDPDDALAILGEAHHADPTDRAVAGLLSVAEAALVEQIRRQGFAPDTVPVPARSRDGVAPGSGSPAPTPAERFILELADGSMDIQSMIWIAPMRMIEVLRALRSLVKNGWIELRSAE